MKINKIRKRVLDKLFCKRGESHLVAILAISLIVVVAAVAIFLPKTKEISENQFDKVDETLEEMWDYK
jgi:uncharacterized membrane protein